MEEGRAALRTRFTLLRTDKSLKSEYLKNIAKVITKIFFYYCVNIPIMKVIDLFSKIVFRCITPLQSDRD